MTKGTRLLRSLRTPGLRRCLTSAVPILNRNTLPATFLRGGTSKGIFLNRAHLPKDVESWAPIFRGIMGSPDAEYARQLNGMGGGVSSLSKIVVVDGSNPEELSYTFVQVGIRDGAIDYTGNCGNLSAMVGVFALDEDLIKLSPSAVTVDKGGIRRTSVLARNTNTDKIISMTFPVSDSNAGILDLPETFMAGVSGQASQILLDFLSPAGARTGKLLPTGEPLNTLHIPSPSGNGKIEIRASLVDATNPTVFVAASEVESTLKCKQIDYEAKETSSLLESIRQEGARLMGLDPNAQAQPKIAVLAKSDDSSADIVVRALSMGVLHRAVPMTVGLCLGVASHIPRSLPNSLVGHLGSLESGLVRISHPSGVVGVGAKFDASGEVLSATVSRTGRRLMRGEVFW